MENFKWREIMKIHLLQSSFFFPYDFVPKLSTLYLEINWIFKQWKKYL